MLKHLQSIILILMFLLVSACSTPVEQLAEEDITPAKPSITATHITEKTSPIAEVITRKVSELDGMVMIFIPEGPFVMGGGTEIDERFKHEVLLDEYWIDQTEVTIGMYTACIENGGCTPPSRNDSLFRQNYFDDPSLLDYPVIFVNWYQAMAYCDWVDRRLPTEAEWEKAARGTDERKYPWGGDKDCLFSNYWGENEMCVGDLVAVMSYPEGISPYGVYEMAGNVYEWVADWYGSEYYTISPGQNPQGPETGTTRVLRGGSFLHLPRMMYTFSRNNLDPLIADVFTGFRCAQSP